MQAAYISLHQQGHAHSIEIWQQNADNDQEKTLVGGLYGVAISGYFSGESMFYRQANASKFALVALANLLKKIDIDFIDCQLLNPFLQDMGAIEISRDSFLQRQLGAINKVIPKDFWHKKALEI
jgi:leucyl/phenylalanyl-tRNA--protein transferase